MNTIERCHIQIDRLNKKVSPLLAEQPTLRYIYAQFEFKYLDVFIHIMSIYPYYTYIGIKHEN